MLPHTAAAAFSLHILQNDDDDGDDDEKSLWGVGGAGEKSN